VYIRLRWSISVPFASRYPWRLAVIIAGFTRVHFPVI
jgi:hypothetical protein